MVYMNAVISKFTPLVLIRKDSFFGRHKSETDTASLSNHVCMYVW